MEDLIQKYKYNYLQYTLTSKQTFKDSYENIEKEMQSFYSQPKPEPEPKQQLYTTTSPPKIQSNWLVIGLGLLSFLLVVL
jgi:hypothetical protein